MVCLAALLGFAFTANAQTAKTTTNTTKTVSRTNGKVAVEKKKTVKTGATKTETRKGVVLKKDGTPDKRYKTSKVLKKDGTPDMRYKVNKKTSTTTVKK